MSWHAERFEARPGRFRQDCAQCSRPMWFPPSKAGKYLTCGNACGETRRGAVQATRERTCVTCNVRFVPRTTQLARGGGRFCSQACNTSGRAALCAPEAQAKAVARKREMFASGELVGLRGEANPRWNGGKELAMARRRIEVAEYKRRNPGRVREWSATRRSKGRVPPGLVKHLALVQRSRCAICRAKLGRGFHLDHIEPLRRGGTNDRGNFQLLCRPCNLFKAAKDPIAFMQERGYLL